MRTVLMSGLLSVAACIAQDSRSAIASINPCPGGKGVVSAIDAVVVPSLDNLLRMSDLVVVGTVLKALPAFSMSPDHPESIETDTQVSVTEGLWGSIPANGTLILLFQMGGTAGSCTEIVPQDPLVQPNEQYIFFLQSDKRKVSNISGIPRYQVAGLWSGKAQIVNGKIHFPARANIGLHRYDNMDAPAFLATVKDMITVLSGYKQLH